MKVIAREKAAKLGLNKFYTGKVCRNGHTAERYVINGACVDCCNANAMAQKQRFRDLLAEARATGVSSLEVI